MENNLVQSWEFPLLGEVVSITSGNSSLTKKVYKEDGQYTAFSGTGPDGKVDFFENEGSAIILSAVGARCGKCFKAKGRWTTIANTSIIKTFLDDEKHIEYLFYLLNNENFWPKGGSGQPFVQTGKAQKETQIPLPPLPEQHRIVAKLDAIMQKVEINKHRLDKIPKLLKRFRQSVLAAAVSGKLTEEWREKNGIENLFEISEQFSINDTYREQNELPENWKWVALGNYVKCNRGRFSIRPRNDPRYFGGDIPFIQIGDLPREGGFVNSHTQTLNELGLKVSKMFPKNTLAVAIVGATIANTGILAYDMCFTDSMVGMNKGDLDLNLFIDYYLRIEKENFRQLSYAGGGQPNIKLELLNSYPFPLPPKEEQTEIVHRVEQLFAFADKIEARYTKAKAMLDKLPQSILAKAFRGELVAQDPNDEPASVLLERIRAEKEKLAAEKKSKKTKVYDIEEKPLRIAAEKGVGYGKVKN